MLKIRPLSILLALAACVQPPAHQIDVPPPVTLAKPDPVPEPPAVAAEPLIQAAPVPTPIPPPLEVTSKVKYTRLEGQHAKALRAVTIGVDVIGANPGVLAIEFVSPEGTIYERREVRLQESAFTAQHFDFELKIAGTWIDTQDMNGRWTAHAYLYGAERNVVEFQVLQ